MRIAIDIRNIGKKRTGDEAVFSNLVRNFAELDSKNKYYLFIDSRSEEALEKMRTDLGINGSNNFKMIPLGSGNKFVWNFWTVQRRLRKHPVDIYLTQYITPFFVPRKIKIATIIHDVSFIVFPELIRKRDLLFLRMLIPLSIKRADKVIGVSEFTKREIVKYFKTEPKKVAWMHNAVSDGFIKELESLSEDDKEEAVRKFDLPEKFILYIGTLQPRKNIPLLIEAFAKAKDRLDGAKLVLAGGKGYNYDARIDSAIEKNCLESEVIMPGFVGEKDKAALMSLASCVCSPSLYEGFGIPVLEGFVAGVPVVASRIPPHEEISGGTAVLFDPADAAELSRDLVRIMSDEKLRASVVKNEKERAGLFSWKSSAEKVLEIFRSMG
ncbi:MAG: glycosyltransferase family 4 protein [Candidatus Moranbacteria bacterium]|nr:glycosyltransferase family 4 protein [Candidatus Moranbacteria bacterium]